MLLNELVGFGTCWRMVNISHTCCLHILVGPMAAQVGVEERVLVDSPLQVLIRIIFGEIKKLKIKLHFDAKTHVNLSIVGTLSDYFF